MSDLEQYRETLAAALFGDAAHASCIRGETREQIDAEAKGLADALSDVEQEPPAEPPDVSFDGGVREPAPLPSDPEAEHNQLVAEVLRRQHNLGGGEW